MTIYQVFVNIEWAELDKILQKAQAMVGYVKAEPNHTVGRTYDLMIEAQADSEQSVRSAIGTVPYIIKVIQISEQTR